MRLRLLRIWLAPLLVLAFVIADLAVSPAMAVGCRPNPWDVNGDGMVNILDVELVGQHWLESGTPGWIPEDVNCDGFVNVTDVELIGSHWLETISAGGATSTPVPTSTAAVPTPTSSLSAASVGTLTFGQPMPAGAGTFTVDVIANLDRGVMLAGYQFAVEFDPAILQAQDVVMGPMFTQWAASHNANAIVVQSWVPVQQPGRTQIGGVSLFPVTSSGPNGTGTLATITFRPLVNNGSSLLTVDSLILTTVSIQSVTLDVTPENIVVGQGGGSTTPTLTTTPNLTPTTTSTPVASSMANSSATATLTPVLSLTPTPTRQPPTNTPQPTPTISTANMSLSLSPSTVNLDVNGQATINVILDSGTIQNRAINFGLAFDQTKINILSVDQGTYYSDWATANASSGALVNSFPWLVDNNQGIVSVGGPFLTGGPPFDSIHSFSIAGPSGLGTVAVITVQGVANGTANIGLTQVTLGIEEPELPDGVSAQLVPGTITGGRVLVGTSTTTTPTATVTATGGTPGVTETATPTRTPIPGTPESGCGSSSNCNNTATPTGTPLPNAGRIGFGPPVVVATPSRNSPGAGDIFTVPITVDVGNSVQVGGIQFALAWDPSVLQLQTNGVTAGPFLLTWAQSNSRNGQPATAQVTNPFTPDNTAGKTTTGGIALLNTKAGKGPNGSGTIAVAKFKALRVGQSSISVSAVIVDREVGVDAVGSSVLEQDSLTVTNGTVAVSNAATATPTVTATTTTTATPTITTTPTTTTTPTPTTQGTAVVATPTPVNGGSIPATATPPIDPSHTTLVLSPTAVTLNASGTTKLSVNITTDQVTRGLQFGVKYDPKIVKIQSIDEDTYYSNWANGNGATTNVFPSWNDDNNGTISVGGLAIYGGPIDPNAGVSIGGSTGSGTVATISLQAVANGQTTIELTGAIVTASTSDGRSVSVAPSLVGNAQITVGDVTITLTPTTGGTPGLTPTVVSASLTPDSSVSNASSVLAATNGAAGQVSGPVNGAGVSTTSSAGTSGTTVQSGSALAAVSNGTPGSAAPSAAGNTQPGRAGTNPGGANANSHTTTAGNGQNSTVLGAPGDSDNGSNAANAGAPGSVSSAQAGSSLPSVAGVRTAGGAPNGVGAAGSPVQAVIDLQSSIDDQGRILRDIVYSDPSHAFSVRVPAGTLALTADRRPLRSITIQFLDDHPVVPDDQALVGRAAEFGPAGATFDPPIRISLAYNPADLGDGLTDGDLDLAFFDTQASKWVSLDASVELATATVSASVPHFTTFAIVTKTAPGVNWLVLFGVLALELGLGAAAYVYILRRRSILAAAELSNTAWPTLEDEQSVVSSETVAAEVPVSALPSPSVYVNPVEEEQLQQ